MEFFVPHSPIPKPRPRFTTFRGKSRAYTPIKAMLFERAVASAARLARSEVFTGPLYVKMIFFLNRPTTVKRPFPCVTPDIDNFLKSAMDGLNKIAFKDDALVCKVEAEKVYCNEFQSTPGVYIEIKEYL